jgi:cytochrome c peroxidase
MHTAKEVCIDDFQAHRAPDNRYRTAPLGGIAFRMSPANAVGPFYHDGRFKTLLDVVNHYNDPACMNLGLANDEKSDLIAYLLSL